MDGFSLAPHARGIPQFMLRAILSQALDVRRILEPNGKSIERSESTSIMTRAGSPGLRRRVGVAIAMTA